MLCSSNFKLSPLDYLLWVSFSLDITLGQLQLSFKHGQRDMNQA